MRILCMRLQVTNQAKNCNDDFCPQAVRHVPSTCVCLFADFPHAAPRENSNIISLDFHFRGSVPTKINRTSDMTFDEKLRCLRSQSPCSHVFSSKAPSGATSSVGRIARPFKHYAHAVCFGRCRKSKTHFFRPKN